jgi:hypothetical protein
MKNNRRPGGKNYLLRNSALPNDNYSKNFRLNFKEFNFFELVNARISSIKKPDICALKYHDS